MVAQGTVTIRVASELGQMPPRPSDRRDFQECAHSAELRADRELSLRRLLVSPWRLFCGEENPSDLASNRLLELAALESWGVRHTQAIVEISLTGLLV